MSIHSAGFKEKNPIMVAWEITDECNLNCRFCYKNKVTSGISKEKIRRILKEILSIPTINVISVTGGEPTLSEHFFEIIPELCKNGKYLVITSNGRWNNKEKIIELLKMYKDKVRVQLSIEGKKRIHDSLRGKGSFDQVINIAKECIRNGIKVSFMMTVFKTNLSEIYFLSSLTKKLNVDFMGVERFVPTGISEKFKSNVLSQTKFRDLFKKIKNLQFEGYKIYLNDPLCGVDNRGIGCTAGIVSLCITTRGDVLPCSKLRVVSGNIFKESLKNIWKNSEIFQILRDRSKLKGKCKTCKYNKYCGGCRAFASALNGDILSEDPLCFISKSSLE